MIDDDQRETMQFFEEWKYKITFKQLIPWRRR